MKTLMLFLLLFLIGLASVSANILSLPINGIYVAVIDWPGNQSVIRTNEPFHFDDKQVWSAYCNTGKVLIFYPLDPAYGVKVKMLAPDGKEVRKTSLGKSYGSKWDKLHSYNDTRMRFGFPEGPFEQNHGEGSGPFIPSPQELFKMDKPGIYTMQIEIQALRYNTATNINKGESNLLRFSPINIKVEKPSEN